MGIQPIQIAVPSSSRPNITLITGTEDEDPLPDQDVDMERRRRARGYDDEDDMCESPF